MNPADRSFKSQFQSTVEEYVSIGGNPKILAHFSHGSAIEAGMVLEGLVTLLGELRKTGLELA